MPSLHKALTHETFQPSTRNFMISLVSWVSPQKTHHHETNSKKQQKSGSIKKIWWLKLLLLVSNSSCFLLQTDENCKSKNLFRLLNKTRWSGNIFNNSLTMQQIFVLKWQEISTWKNRQITQFWQKDFSSVNWKQIQSFSDSDPERDFFFFPVQKTFESADVLRK